MAWSGHGPAAMSDRPGKLLIVDDDPDILTAGALLLRRHHAGVLTTTSPDDVPGLLREHTIDAILLDMNYRPGASNAREGLRWLERILAIDPAMVVIAVTAYGNVEVAVEAMKRGAADFVTKPWRNDKLVATVRAAIDARGRAAPVTVVPAADGELLYRSREMAELVAVIDRTARTDASVLILGENGSGKEMVARAIHARSPRATRGFGAIDLGAVSESVFEAELFGHRRGAFTDARDDRIGRLEAASGGTLFLDELGNLPLRLQAKLLTVLERREVTTVGAVTPVSIDVRVISATNVAAERLRDPQVFRQDLLYRLNTVVVTVPPLRARPADVDVLLAHFLAGYARRYQRPVPRVEPSALEALRRYPWPGNVRELKHAVERAVIVSQGDLLDLDAFDLAPTPLSPHGLPLAEPAGPPVLNLDEVERTAVVEALRKHQWNVSRAAKELGITRASLYRRMEKYDL